jgi:hypothetical protein
MAEDDTRPDPEASDALAALGHKLDTVAGAVAAVASTHIEVLNQAAEAEARRSQDAQEIAQRLDAVERQILAMSAPEASIPAAAPDLEPLRADIALSLEVLSHVTEAVERIDSRTEDRLAAVRDAAAAPIADLQALLAARNERHDTQLAELTTAVDGLAAEGPAAVREQLAALAAAVDALVARPSGADASSLERVDDLASATQALTWKLPELGEELAALREQVERQDVAGPLAEVSLELSDRLTLHTDTALAGILRLIDERLTALRTVLAEGPGAPPSPNVGGFEAGAVMGAAQAAWNRLEQRLDSEFDDLGRQLQSMAAMIEQAVATTEAVANRPVVTGDQLRRAASAVKDSVVGAGRSRRERRGGPRGLGSGR